MNTATVFKKMLRFLLCAAAWALLFFGCLLAVLLVAEYADSLWGIVIAAVASGIGAVLAIALLKLSSRLRAEAAAPSEPPQDAPAEPSAPQSDAPAAPSAPQKDTPPAAANPNVPDELLKKVAEVLTDLLRADKPLPLTVTAPAPRAEQRSRFIVRGDGSDIRLIVGVHERDSDMLIQHYLFKGTRDELFAYLASDETQQAWAASLAELSDAVFYHD